MRVLYGASTLFGLLAGKKSRLSRGAQNRWQEGVIAWQH